MTRITDDTPEEEEEEYRPRRSRRGPLGNPDEFVHPGRQLLHLMRAQDAARRAVTAATHAIQEHLDHHEDLKEMYSDFVMRGGSTADEMSAWLVDDDWRRKDFVLRKKHLMLLEGRADTPKKKLLNRPRLRRRRDDDEPRGAA